MKLGQLVVGSALVFAVGCSDPLYEGEIDGHHVTLEESNWIIRSYDLTIKSPAGYIFEIRDWGANGSADTLEVYCPDNSVHCSIKYHGDKQELYDRFMRAIAGDGTCNLSCPLPKRE